MEQRTVRIAEDRIVVGKPWGHRIEKLVGTKARHQRSRMETRFMETSNNRKRCRVDRKVVDRRI